MVERDILLLERLNQFPEIKKLFEELIAAVENNSGKLDKADDMEKFLFYGLRNGGQMLFESWAKNQEAKNSNDMSQNVEAKKHGKKKSTFAQSTGK